MYKCTQDHSTLPHRKSRSSHQRQYKNTAVNDIKQNTTGAFPTGCFCVASTHHSCLLPSSMLRESSSAEIKEH